MTTVSDFYPGTDVSFSIILKIEGVAQNITGDTVTFRMKSARDNTDAAADVEKAADVATQGAAGIATVSLSNSDTDVAVGRYYCDIEWVTSGGDVHVAYDDTVHVLSRTSDS